MSQGPLQTLFRAMEEQPPDEGLETVAALRVRLESLESLHVERALRAGWSWRRIAEPLGVSKQAVHKKHARRLADKVAATPDRSQLVVTGQARRSVRCAREEATALGADALRCEHLVLGLLREERGPVIDALAAAGVSLEAARRCAAGLERDGEVPEAREDGRLPVSAGARAVMEQSLREAVRRRDTHLGVEHLLFAVVRDRDGRGARLLAGLHVDPASLEGLLDERLRGAE
jgi:Clp amino terminal domain, pathogenicity island component